LQDLITVAHVQILVREVIGTVGRVLEAIDQGLPLSNVLQVCCHVVMLEDFNEVDNTSIWM